MFFSISLSFWAILILVLGAPPRTMLFVTLDDALDPLWYWGFNVGSAACKESPLTFGTYVSPQMLFYHV